MPTYRIKIGNTLNGMEFTQDREAPSADAARAALNEEIRTSSYTTWSVLEITEVPATTAPLERVEKQVNLPTIDEEQARPHLWNPRTIANSSVIITPLLSAFLTAKNWESMENHKRAYYSIIWFYFGIVLFLSFPLLEISFKASGISTVGYVFCLVIWYFFFGKRQLNYVRDIWW